MNAELTLNELTQQVNVTRVAYKDDPSATDMLKVSNLQTYK